MTIEMTYTHARANLAKLLDQVTQDREIVIIKRRDAEDAAVISAKELSSLLETVHLFSSPANAERLLNALARSERNEGKRMTIDELRREVGFAE